MSGKTEERKTLNLFSSLPIIRERKIKRKEDHDKRKLDIDSFKSWENYVNMLEHTWQGAEADLSIALDRLEKFERELSSIGEQRRKLAEEIAKFSLQGRSVVPEILDNTSHAGETQDKSAGENSTNSAEPEITKFQDGLAFPDCAKCQCSDCSASVIQCGHCEMCSTKEPAPGDEKNYITHCVDKPNFEIA